MRIALFAAAVLATAALSGCSDMPRSSIHGTVKYQGKPLAGATVVFLAKDNQTHVANLGPDGTFKVSGVARGPVKVSIQQDPPRPASKADPTVGGPSKTGVKDEKAGAARPADEPKVTGPRIPARYADPEKSGLAFELTEPDQEWSVDLK